MLLTIMRLLMRCICTISNAHNSLYKGPECLLLNMAPAIVVDELTRQ